MCLQDFFKASSKQLKNIFKKSSGQLQGILPKANTYNNTGLGKTPVKRRLQNPFQKRVFPNTSN